MTLEQERKALEEQRRTLEREKKEFARRVENEDRRLEQQQKLFDMKFKILEEELVKLAKEKDADCSASSSCLFENINPHGYVRHRNSTSLEHQPEAVFHHRTQTYRSLRPVQG